MRRKIIKQKDSYTITLPKKWVESNGLTKDSEIFVDDVENVLEIRGGEREKVLMKTSLLVDSDDFHVYRSLIGAHYRDGYDEIFVKFSGSKSVPLLQDTVDGLYGYDLFDLKDSSCLIKSIFEESEIDLELHFKKMIHIIVATQKMIKNDLDINKFDSVGSLENFRKSILKQRDLISRVIIKQKTPEAEKCSKYYLSFILWNIFRNYYTSYSYLQKENSKDDDVIKVLEITSNFFNEIFNNLRIDTFNESFDLYKDNRKEIVGLLEGKSKFKAFLAYQLNALINTQNAKSIIFKTEFKKK